MASCTTRHFKGAFPSTEFSAGTPDRFAQHIPVADMVGEYQDELAVHQLSLAFAHIALEVDQFLIEAIGVGDIGFGFEWHDQALLHAATARASAFSIFAGSKSRQRAATCWSGRIR